MGAALARLHYTSGDGDKADAVIKRFLSPSEIRMGLSNWAVRQALSIYSDFEQYEKLNGIEEDCENQ